MGLANITLRGYKSFTNLERFELLDLNVLIGANGAGKSNFISAFRFISSAIGENFQVDIQKDGGPDAFLHKGRKHSTAMDLEIEFQPSQDCVNTYRITLEPTQDNRLIFTREESGISGPDGEKLFTLDRGFDTSKLADDAIKHPHKVSDHTLGKLKTWRQYHFHDTSKTSAVKAPHPANDNLRLKPDAANLAAFLRRLQGTPEYRASYVRIVETIRMAAPYFHDFIFRDSEFAELEWTERGNPDTPWKAHMLSDGTLRFICLATLLMQPESLMPDTILIDEPELGLHPFAINLLAGLLQRASEFRQVIVSTQSVELVNALEPRDIIVADRKGDATTLKRLDGDELRDWIDDDYALGELWKRNILGGRPAL